MKTGYFSPLKTASMVQTRDVLHAYSRILGDCLKRCRSKRKHWWHASLRPSLTGLSTGVVYSRRDFELELNFRESLLCGRTETAASLAEKLEGQVVPELAARVAGFLMDNGVDEKQAAGAGPRRDDDSTCMGVV